MKPYNHIKLQIFSIIKFVIKLPKLVRDSKERLLQFKSAISCAGVCRASLLRRSFNTACIKAREATARFLTQRGVEPAGGGG